MMDMKTLQKFMEKINSEGKFKGLIKYDEAMSEHCTFKAGGPADVWVRPGKAVFKSYAARLLGAAKQEGIPVFILGAGANILVSDRGIRGIVLDTGSWAGSLPVIHRDNSPNFDESAVCALSGTQVDKLVDSLARRGLSALEFLGGMPGSVGGAVWMNARCYEKSISDVLLETEILDENYEIQKIPFRKEDFSYKKSPFQSREVLILSASFKIEAREPKEMRREINSYRKDRRDKGHYRFPSAGSAFKNNHAFGEPSGKIIDQAGLRG